MQTYGRQLALCHSVLCVPSLMISRCGRGVNMINSGTDAALFIAESTFSSHALSQGPEGSPVAVGAVVSGVDHPLPAGQQLAMPQLPCSSDIRIAHHHHSGPANTYEWLSSAIMILSSWFTSPSD